MANFETVVQEVIYDKLINTTGLMAVINAVYDDVPQANSSGSEAAFPYITIGEDSHVDISTDLELMNQVSITIHTWSRFSGRSETKKIQGLVYDTLNRANLYADGYKFININSIGSESFLDSDGFTRHGVQTFNLLIERLKEPSLLTYINQPLTYNGDYLTYNQPQ